MPVEDALRYVLSLPISTLVSGIDSEKVLDQNLKIVRDFKPLTDDETAADRGQDAASSPATAGSSCSSRRRCSTARSTASSTGSTPTPRRSDSPGLSGSHVISTPAERTIRVRPSSRIAFTSRGVYDR